jgi:Flp pilus assembly protein TadG
MRRIKRDEGGTAAVEAAVLIPVLILFGIVAIGFGRYEVFRAELIGDARAGAEAASVMQSPQQAQVAAEAAASVDEPQPGWLCGRSQVVTDTRGFAPGGTVSVSVLCSVDLANLGIPGLAGIESVAVAQGAPIDEYRTVAS